MSINRTEEYLGSLLNELRALPNETGWVEFKHNNEDPQKIGEYISALSNSAPINGKHYAYIVWGIDDATHEIVGTSFKPKSTKRGNEELENWLVRSLSPRIQFTFYELDTDKGNVVILEIERAANKPVQFLGKEYIRIGSYKKNLKDFPEVERDGEPLKRLHLKNRLQLNI